MAELVLCGANPGVRLFADGEVTALASVWVVDWSQRGQGEAVVLWHEGRVRVLTESPELGRWLEGAFTRHFPEAEGLAWPEPSIEVVPLAVALDFGAGTLSARGADVEVTMSGVLHRREFSTDAFLLAGVPHGLRLVLAPVAEAGVVVGGRVVPGEVERGGSATRPTSSAFLTTAEVWLR